ncbi:hypothetical protein [Lactococcus sp.]|uniref:hypothetical protein n=1 Tax=Lactococcus sp. TaxID=44273 RepID=UPI0035AF7E7E
MKLKSVKAGVISGAALAALTLGGVVIAHATITSSATAATTTDVETGPTAAKVNTANLLLTAPKTVTVPVGATQEQVKAAIGAFAQYVNSKMLSSGEYTQAQFDSAKNGAATLEALGAANPKHSTDIITVSAVDTSKAGTTVATVTAAGASTNTPDATVPVTVVVGAASTPLYSLAKGNDHFLTTDLNRAFALQAEGYNSLKVVAYVPTTGTVVSNWYSASLKKHVFTTETTPAYIAHLKALGYAQLPSTVHSANATDTGAVPVSVSFNNLANHFYTAYALPAGYGNARTAFYAATKEEVTGIPSTDTMVAEANAAIKAYLATNPVLKDGQNLYPLTFLPTSPVQSVTYDATTGKAVVTVAVKASETKALALGISQTSINAAIQMAENAGTASLLGSGVKSVSYVLD